MSLVFDVFDVFDVLDVLDVLDVFDVLDVLEVFSWPRVFVVLAGKNWQRRHDEKSYRPIGVRAKAFATHRNNQIRSVWCEFKKIPLQTGTKVVPAVSYPVLLGCSREGWPAVRVSTQPLVKERRTAGSVKAKYRLWQCCRLPQLHNRLPHPAGGSIIALPESPVWVLP